MLLLSCSVVSDSATPWTIAHQASLSMGFSRQEHWSGLPFPSPGDRLDPGIDPTSPALAGRLFTTEPSGNPLLCSGLDYVLLKYQRCVKGLLSLRNDHLRRKHECMKPSSLGPFGAGAEPCPPCLGPPRSVLRPQAAPSFSENTGQKNTHAHLSVLTERITPARASYIVSQKRASLLLRCHLGFVNGAYVSTCFITCLLFVSEIACGG